MAKLFSPLLPLLILILTFGPLCVSTQEEGEQVSPPAEGGDAGDGGSVSRTCGGVINGNQGRIEYKHLRPYAANERCVWAINSPGSASITFTVEANGILQTTQDYLAVGYFNNSDYKTAASYKERILRHNSPTRNTATVPGPTAFLHFISDKSIHGLGFIVSFTSESAEFPPSHHFNNFHYAGDFGAIRYPPEGEEAKESERLTFFIRPTKAVNLALKRFEGDCGSSRDWLSVYQRRNNFDRSSMHLMQQFCNSPMDKIPMWKVSPETEVVVTLQTNVSRSSELPLSLQLLWIPVE